MYRYESQDGINFTQISAGFTLDQISGIVGYGNTGICSTPVNGKYVAIMEANDGHYWAFYRFESTSLQGPWTYTQKLDLAPAFHNMCGGATVRYENVDGVMQYVLFYHYGQGPTDGLDIGPNLPTLTAFATSLDSVNWKIKEVPVFGIEDYPYGPPQTALVGTTQAADWMVEEVNGHVNSILTLVENDEPRPRAQLRMTKANFTMQNLVSNLVYPVDTNSYLDWIPVPTRMEYHQYSHTLGELTDASAWGISSTVATQKVNNRNNATGELARLSYHYSTKNGGSVKVGFAAPANNTAAVNDEFLQVYQDSSGGFGVYGMGDVNKKFAQYNSDDAFNVTVLTFPDHLEVQTVVSGSAGTRYFSYNSLADSIAPTFPFIVKCGMQHLTRITRTQLTGVDLQAY